MSDFPVTICKPMPGLHTMSLEALGRGYDWTGAVPASGAWPLANLALFIPFQLCVPVIATALYSFNGATLTANIDVGIYDEAGTRLVSNGSVAMAGASALQPFDITDTQIGPGKFYLAVALSTNTGTLFRAALTTMLCSVLGMAQMEAAFPLPANAVFATCAYGYWPIIAACVGGNGFL